MRTVVYLGRPGRRVQTVEIDGHRLSLNAPTEVPEKLADELDGGTPRLPGHEFQVEPRGPAPAEEDWDDGGDDAGDED